MPAISLETGPGNRSDLDSRILPSSFGALLFRICRARRLRLKSVSFFPGRLDFDGSPRRRNTLSQICTTQANMLAPTRSLLRYWRSLEKCSCSSTIRPLTTSATSHSGHSRWSTIKHDKAKKDASKTRQRTLLSKEIEHAVKSE